MIFVETYLRPKSLQQALEALASPGHKFRILAGGTDLYLDLKREGQKVDILDIGLLEECKTIKKVAGGLQIGAGVTFTQLEQSALIERLASPLKCAAADVGSPQIRNVGTIGGNLVKASPAADSVTALVAMDAVVFLQSQEGKRTLPVADFLKGAYQTALLPNELLVSVFVPNCSQYTWGFTKLGRRRAGAISLFTAAIGLEVAEDKTIESARVSLGAVAQNPYRSEMLETLLIGKNTEVALSEELLEAATVQVMQTVGQRPELPYKKAGISGIISETFEKALAKGEV